MRALLDRLLQGNTHAVNLCLAVFEWANDYDHLVDGDVTGVAAEQALHNAMWAMAVTIPQNPFYKVYQPELGVSLANGIATWRVATALQRQGDDHALMLAHVLRWTLIEFFLHCARLVGGRHWAEAQAPGFWRAMTQDHSFAQFVAESKGA